MGVMTDVFDLNLTLKDAQLFKDNKAKTVEIIYELEIPGEE